MRRKPAITLRKKSSYLPNTKCAEDAVQDVIRRGGSCNRIDRCQSTIEIDQQRFMRNPRCDGGVRAIQIFTSFLKQPFVPDAGDEPFLARQRSFRHNRAAKFVNPLPC